MNIYALLISGIFSGIVLSFLLTKEVIKKVIQCGIVDHPREDRFHSETTALMGGISIHYAFILLLTLFNRIDWIPGLVLILGVGAANYFILKKMRKQFIITSMAVILSYAILILLIHPSWDGIRMKFQWFVLGMEVLYFTGSYDDGFKPVTPLLKLGLQIIAALCLTIGKKTITFLPAPYHYFATVI